MSWHALALGLAVILAADSAKGQEFSAERSNALVRFGQEYFPYKVMGAFVLPGETVPIEVVTRPPGLRYVPVASAGRMDTIGLNRWRWIAPPAPGLCYVMFISPDSVEFIQLNVFVMVPYREKTTENLNSYRIGPYPRSTTLNGVVYTPPRGFIEVTRQNEEVRISPHFRLKQFLCKQPDGYPKYVVLKERLLLKLELILEQANRKGYHAPTFHIMSGYRTPFYNRAIGNVAYSRHQYGDAADVFIDHRPADGRMDDLNADGRRDVRDAQLLVQSIEAMAEWPDFKPLAGGLGGYGPTSNHGPFIHVDVRGYAARWGAAR
jgi:hypothetical protein